MEGRRRVSPLLLVILLGLVLVGAVYLGVGGEGDAPTEERAAGFRGGTLPAELSGRPAPRIRLRDSGGRLVDTRELRGQPYLVTFVFTRCPDVCPLIGQEVKRALELLGEDRERVTALFVSVDPRGDTPEAAQRWLDRQRMPANVRYLIGTEDALEAVWKAHYAAPQLPSRPETSRHTASVWLIDAAGRWRTKFSAGIPVPPEDLAHDLRRLLNEQPAAGSA